MASNPDDARHRHEEEAAALALLLLARRYDLKAMIAARRIRPRPFRRIGPTAMLQGDLARPYFMLVNAWRAERDDLLAAYVAALPERGYALSPGATDRLRAQVDASSAKVAATLAVLIRRFPQIAAAIERWHLAQWNARIRSATGLDVSALSTPQDGQAEVANSVARNRQLAESVHQDTASKVGTLLLNSLSAGASLAFVAAGFNGTMDKAKRRSAGIAADQAETLSSLLTFARMGAAGLDTWRWRHLDPQPHPRPEHVALNGQTFGPKKQPKVRPGLLPWCKCWVEPLWI